MHHQFPAYQPPSEDDLPSLWNVFQTKEGKSYWGHKLTSRTTWEEPASLKRARLQASEAEKEKEEWEADGAAISGWQCYKEKASGRTRWAHLSSKETSTAMPKEVRNVQRQREQEKLKKLQAARKPPPKTDTHEVEDVDTPPPPTKRSTTPPPRTATPPPRQHVPKEQVYGSRAERVTVFKSLLEEKKIPRDMKWADAIKVLLSDERYSVLKTHKDKQDAFAEYCKRQKEAEEEAALAKRKQEKDAFVALFEGYPDQERFPLSYANAGDIFGEDPAWRALDARERRSLLTAFMRTVETKNKEKQRLRRWRNFNSFASLLKEADVSSSTRWAKFEEQSSKLKLQNDDRWTALNDKERKECFREYVRHMENEAERAKITQDAVSAETARTARIALRTFILQQMAEGNATCFTPYQTFADAHPDRIIPHAEDIFHSAQREVHIAYKYEGNAIKAAVKKLPADPAVTVEKLQGMEGLEGVSVQSLACFVEAVAQRSECRQELVKQRQKALKKVVVALLRKGEEEMKRVVGTEPAYEDLEELAKGTAEEVVAGVLESEV